MLTYNFNNDKLMLKDESKTLFGKTKVKETVLDLNELTKIYILVNKPTNVIATMTLYFGKKKQGIFFSDRNQYKTLLDDLAGKYPDITIERDTAGAW